MTAGTKKPDEKDLETPGIERTLRDDAEELLARSPKRSADLKGQTPEQLIHELEVHQVELETQAEELRRAYIALEESRDKYLDLYDFAPIGYLTLTDRALIEEVNLAGETLLGVERRKLVNARFRKFIAPEFFEKWDEYFVTVLRQEDKQICTLTLKRSDGSTVPVRVEGIRLDGIDGVITARITISDISDIWQIEALKETNDYLNNLFDYANAPIIVWDPKYVITRFNHAFEDMTLRSEQEVIGRRLDILFPKESTEASFLQINKTLEGKWWETVEIPILVKDGSVRTVLWNSANILDPDGRIISTIAQGVDITERRRAEEALRRVNQKLNILSGLTRKDLSCQILVLNSYLELAKKHAAGQDQVLSSIQKGKRAAESINEITEVTRDYQDMGAKPPTWQNVKMALLLGLSHISISEIKHSIETGDLEIFADPLLEKVCQRLFENSLTHGGHDTRIRVSHTTTPAGITILFEDDGKGIPQEKKEQIFLRGDDLTRFSMRSLIFVREILDITGITITETGEPGKGARFEIMVPEGAWRMIGGSD
jgi:PAS domain S-box-containing protein